MVIDLYTKNSCSRCEAVIEALQKKNIPFLEHVIGQDILRENVLDLFPGARLLPIVVIDGTWIGGRDEVLKKLANGEFDAPHEDIRGQSG